MKYSQEGRGEAVGRTSKWGTWRCRRRCILVWIIPSLATGRIIRSDRKSQAVKRVYYMINRQEGKYLIIY
jgi:hypothetical protein